MGLRIFCGCLITVAGIVMILSTVRCNRYLRYSRDESYGLPSQHRWQVVLIQCVLVFFIIGCAVGAADVFFRAVEPIYLFVGFVFFVGSLYIYFMIETQINITHSLRSKSVEVMRAFVNSVEQKDPCTQGHSLHVYYLAGMIYEQLPAELKSRVNQPKRLDAAMLHDIGKIGIDDAILNKKGPLTDAEWGQMRNHPRVGRQMLQNTSFSQIGDWVLYHHERVDGTGYFGLDNARIPIEAKIISVADTYSAITTHREYRPPRSHEEAVDELDRVAGTQLDADIVAFFYTIPARRLEKLEQVMQEELAEGGAARLPEEV